MSEQFWREISLSVLAFWVGFFVCRLVYRIHKED